MQKVDELAASLQTGFGLGFGVAVFFWLAQRLMVGKKKYACMDVYS